MAVTTTKTNKPINPRGNDASPLGYNRAALYSGKALDFDGVNDLIAITDSASVSSEFQSIGNNDSYTLCAYFKTTDTTSHSGWIASGNQMMELRQEVSAGKSPFSFGVDGGKLTFGRNDTAGSVSNVYKNSGSVDVATGDYFFGVAVVDNDNVKLYVNGALDLDDTITTSTGDCSVGTTTSNFLIGCRSLDSGGLGNYFDGEISNARLFNTALTAAQVSDLYNNPEKIVPTGVSNTALKLWLPMMEGAGTTAYDGSGNGNHGTISGATYVNGVGAPVTQSAVMDWNKNKNSITNSTDFSAAAGWLSLTSGTGTAVVTNNYAESPYGGQTAARLQATKGTGYGVISFTPAVSTSGTYVSSVWVKSNTGSTQSVSMYSRNSTTGKQDVTTEWTRFEFTGSGTSNYFNIGSLGTADASIDILIWGAQMVLDATEAGPYVPTIGTPQTSPVLLPQGLTSGRDITGVNLFENVRKQGALNLDGNSWAEVHDNASLDFGSGSWTLEAWAYVETTYTAKGILSRWYSASQGPMMWAFNGNFQIYQGRSSGASSTAISTPIPSNGWHHIVGTFDSSDNFIRVYLNGVLKNTSGTIVSPYGSNTLPLEIGRINNDASTEYPNNIAQPRIYNRALTAEEVERNYNAGKNIYK